MSGYMITREREKLLNALAYFSGNVLHPGKTKLFKLLYFLDFLHFQKTGRSVTGLAYEAWERGPVPRVLYDEWKQPKLDFNHKLTRRTKELPNGSSLQTLEAKNGFERKYFSKFEFSLMEKLAKKHFRDNAESMSDSSHFETGPWHEIYEVRKLKSHVIPYELALLRRGNDDDRSLLETAKEYEELVNNYK